MSHQIRLVEVTAGSVLLLLGDVMATLQGFVDPLTGASLAIAAISPIIVFGVVVWASRPGGSTGWYS